VLLSTRRNCPRAGLRVATAIAILLGVNRDRAGSPADPRVVGLLAARSRDFRSGMVRPGHTYAMVARRWKRYEIDVADVLRSRVNDDAVVEEDVHLPTGDGRTRQVDVVIREPVAGMADALVIVDAKERSRKIGAPEVERFVGTMKDVGADYGLIVSSNGFTKGAFQRRDKERGVVLETMLRADLETWSPPQTRHLTLGVPTQEVGRALDVLTEARVRARPTTWGGLEETGESAIQVLRHFGTPNPDPDVELAWWASVRTVLDQAGITSRHLAHGVTFSGGTPKSRWVIVKHDGAPLPSPLKILAASVEDAQSQLHEMEDEFGLSTGSLTIDQHPTWDDGAAMPT
jgi:Restriction endonuclease